MCLKNFQSLEEENEEINSVKLEALENVRNKSVSCYLWGK